MTLKETIEEIKKWSITEQVEFCDRISQTITIGIRSILSYDNKEAIEKLTAIKWLNEFHHRVNNLKFEIKNVISQGEKIEKIGKYAQYYASKNELVSGEIAAIIRLSYQSKIRIDEIEISSKMEESIFDLIVNERFRRKTAMYIGEKKISILRAFIDGYFYGLEVKRIHLREIEPKFEQFNDWIANHFDWNESTKGWAKIILSESNDDEELAVDNFFKLYDEFKLKKE